MELSTDSDAFCLLMQNSLVALSWPQAGLGQPPEHNPGGPCAVTGVSELPVGSRGGLAALW